MKYYFLKLGKGNCDAVKWLKGRNALQKPAAVIYFDDLSESDYLNGQGKNQAQEFYHIGAEASQWEHTRMVVTCKGEVWILKPAGKVQFLLQEQQDDRLVTPKAMPVTVLARKLMKDVPPVLASIGVNQYYARGTFRPINHWGNYKAIDCAIGASLEGDHWDLKKQDPVQLLECLGPLEFETLIASNCSGLFD